MSSPPIRQVATLLRQLLEQPADGAALAPHLPLSPRHSHPLVCSLPPPPGNPFRNLQVQEVFANTGKAANLYTMCVYGGTPYDGQEQALSRGVDVVVGTPGRVKDLLERGTLKLSNIR